MGGGGVRVDVNEEAKCLWKFKKKFGRGAKGCLVGGGGGHGGCERRFEVILKIQKKIGGGGRGVGAGRGGRTGWGGSGWMCTKN